MANWYATRPHLSEEEFNFLTPFVYDFFHWLQPEEKHHAWNGVGNKKASPPGRQQRARLFPLRIESVQV